MKHLRYYILPLLLISGILFCTSIQAQTVMKEGVVTTAPWFNKHFKVRIDGIIYSFMPTVQIDAYFTDYDEQKMTSYLAGKFRVGDRVLIAKQGFRIYRVDFLDK